MSEIIANGVNLASPTEIGLSDEIIWSPGTGRSASGLMSGDVIANKKTISVKWGIITQTEYEAIRNIPSGFFDIQVLGSKLTVYRGTIQGSCLGNLGDGTIYYRDVSTTFIQQ